MTVMGPMGPIPPGTPAYSNAIAEAGARAGYANQYATNGHGAIAYSPSTGRCGYSWSYRSRAEAEQVALSYASAHDAVVYSGHRTYIALARGTNGAYAFSFYRKADDARANAIHECRKYGGTDIYVEALVDTDRGLVK